MIGPAEGRAVAVAVKARIRRQALESVKVVHRIQIAIPEILVKRAVEGVRAALDHGVELAAGGVPELGAELVLQQSEAFDRVVRHHDEISR